MRRTVVALAAAVGLAFAAPAAATPIFGVAENSAKFAGDGGAADYQLEQDLAMSEIRFDVLWNAEDPTTIQDKSFLDRSMPVASKNGIDVVFHVFPSQALAIATGPTTRIVLFAGYLKLLAQTYPQVTKYVVGNEPNQRRFWQPQFNPAAVAGPNYERLLAASYDALKSVNSNIMVIGGVTNSHGNDTPGADNESTSPVRFIKGMGTAYRLSRRTAPIMDELSYHPYPITNTDPPTKHYQWPNAGVSDLDRIKQAFWDAFHGTAQPVFQETGGPQSIVIAAQGNIVKLKIDEIGWQVAILAAYAKYYTGVESVPTIDEATQAQIYTTLIQIAACDPNIAELLIFHLIDETDLERLQTGLLRADRSKRPSYDAVKQAIAAAGNCGTPHTWAHTNSVIGAQPTFDDVGNKPASASVFGFSAYAEEDAYGRGAIFPVSGPGSALAPVDASRSLAVAEPPEPALESDKLIKAYNKPRFEFHGKLQPGFYVYAIRMRSMMNPSRSQTFVSPVFKVG